MEPDEKGKLVKKTYETNKFGEQKIKYEWEFVHTHVYPNVNDAIIEYLISNNLCFELKGLPVQELPIKKPENAMLLKSEFISEKVEHLESNNQSKPKPTVKESSVAQSNEKNIGQFYDIPVDPKMGLVLLEARTELRFHKIDGGDL